MNWIAGAVALAVSLSGAPAGTGSREGNQAEAPGAFEAARAAARKELARALEDYVAWCQGKSLFAERKKAYELLLELVPDHAEARRTLGHKRAKDGSWQPPASPKTFRDFDADALAEAPARWRAAVAGYLAAMSRLLDDPTLAPAERERAMDEVLRFDPDDARVRALRGEVKNEHGWVLAETERAKGQRKVLLDHVRSAHEGAPPAAPAALNERERRIPLQFQAVAARRLRVVGTAKQEELLLAAQAVQAAEYLAQQVLGSRYALPDDTTVFLLDDPGHLPAFLAHHPGIAPDQRAYFEKLEGAGIPGTHDFAFWTGDTQRRIDGIVRLVLGFWLSGAYQVHPDTGWAYEGFGLYLTRALVRSRLTWLAQPSTVLTSSQDVALRQKLIDPATNWMDEALRLLQEGRVPAYPELFAKGATALTTEDVLLAYALATYLLEVRPEAVPRLFERIGTGYARTQGFQDAVEMDLDSFQRHFRRWLEERR